MRLRHAVACVVGAVVALTACGPTTQTTPESTLTATTTITAQTASPLEGIESLKVDPAAPDSAFGGDVPAEQMTPQAAYSYLQQVVTSVDKMWTAYFRSIGNVQSQTRDHDFFYTIVADQAVTSNCSEKPVTASLPNAFYCATDSYTSPTDGKTYQGHVVLPLQAFMRMWNGDIFGQQSVRLGDFGAAVIVAHEIAHSAYDDLRVQFALPKIQNPDGSKHKNNELLADCGAGVWANTAYYQGWLQPGDPEEAVAALNAIGDAREGGRDPHGSPVERGEGFVLGYNSGSPVECVKAYWPDVEFK